MSTREKRLLALFLVAIVAIGGWFGYGWFTGKREQTTRQIAEYRSILEVADMASAQWDSVQSEVAWLEEHEPEPAVGELVKSKLESLTTMEARRAGLTIKQPKILENETSGAHYHRARFQISITGKEPGLYNWLCRVHSPKDFRAVTELRLSPNREDDTQIDATVQVEQWFVPVAEGAEVAETPVAAPERPVVPPPAGGGLPGLPAPELPVVAPAAPPGAGAPALPTPPAGGSE